MTDIFSVRHEEQRSIKSADQVELMAIQSGIAVPDIGIVDESISGELEDLDLPFGPIEPWQGQDVHLDDEVGSVRTELSRRSDVMGRYYPFQLNNGVLIYTPSITGFYEYCLGISNITKSITKSPNNKLPRSFERLACLILQKHMGPGWEGLHTGWPRDPGQPRRLASLIHDCVLTGSIRFSAAV